MKKKMMKDQAEKIYGKIENGMYQRPVTQREQLDTFMKLKQMENIDFDNSIANKRVGIQEEMLKLRQAYDTAKKSGNEEQANIYKLLLEKMGNEKY
jgi:predicted outer membrane protein